MQEQGSSIYEILLLVPESLFDVEQTTSTFAQSRP